jgi:hypothetical protein
MERYRFYKKLSGRDTARTFEQYNLYDYVTRYFESLHTMGDQAIMKDIDAYIAEADKGI